MWIMNNAFLCKRDPIKDLTSEYAVLWCQAYENNEFLKMSLYVLQSLCAAINLLPEISEFKEERLKIGLH